MTELIFTERELEDLVEARCIEYLGLNFIKRQHRTPAGIIDVIARNVKNRHVYYIIELKRGCLDASAYAQVMTYAKWMNSEESKDGKRIFIPMLIGDTLHNCLSHLCNYYELGEMDNYKHNVCASWLKSVFIPVYRCFNFSLFDGIRMDYCCPAQDNAANLYNNFNDIFENYDIAEYFKQEARNGQN